MRNKEERKRIAQMGAAASAQVRREKRSLKQIAAILLEGKPQKKHIAKAKALFESLDMQVSSVKDICVVEQVRRAMKGDTFAFREIKDLLGDEEIDPASNTQPVKVDFETFCRNASYPLPFAKQTEFIDFSFGGGFRMLEAARGYGKTDYVAIVRPAYEIYKNPKKTFIVINKDKSKAKSAIAEMARCLEANGVDLEVNTTSNFRVKGLVGKQDNGKAMSTKMSPKQNHPDFIICDDIVDIKDKYSPAERKYIRDYFEALTGLSDNIIFLGQPVFYKDLYSEIRHRLKVMSLPHGSIPELDHDLEARRAAGVSEAFINANYHLKVSADASVPFAGIEEVNFFPSSSSFMWIDPSDGQGDYTAICVLTGNFEDLIFAGFCFNKAWYECEEELKQIWSMYRAEKGGFETNKHGNHPVILLRQKGLNFAGRATTENKEAKIQNAATHKKNIKLSTFVPNKNADLIEANKLFNKTVKEYEYKGGTDIKDDAPDAIASAMLYLGILTMEKK